MKNIKKSQMLGFFLGVAIVIVIPLLNITNLSRDGKICLAISLFAVCWWAFKVMAPGFTSLALLVGYSLFLDNNVVTGNVIFSAWVTPVMYLVIGGFLIAEAVQDSGLGERLSLIYAKRFINNYRDIILSCYILGLILSFAIPHPWPRSFLILSVMNLIIGATDIEKKYADNIRLAVFVSSIPTSMVLLTGDSTLNPVLLDLSGASASWLSWLLYMGVPGLAATSLMFILQTILFGKPKTFNMNKKVIEERLANLGKLKKEEKICIAVLVLAVIAWMTDSITGIHPAWIAVIAVVIFALPKIEVLKPKSLTSINIGTLLFLSAAISIGSVGHVTGLNDWIAHVLLPSQSPTNPYVFALLVSLICMAIHMLLGSTLAVLSIAVPAIVSFGSASGFPPLTVAFIAYIAIVSHWILPFHHMNLLVGCSENTGNLQEKNIIKFGIPQTIITLIISVISITWWNIIGRI